ncbi:MAG: hypothetical protein QW753_01175 [Thermofilum sp.]|uniref:Uncharacterized protein n=1 Tax=Thermofilum pendens TaxID=2269 RepID=A0A7C4H670_THEPE
MKTSQARNSTRPSRALSKGSLKAESNISRKYTRIMIASQAEDAMRDNQNHALATFMEARLRA